MSGTFQNERKNNKENEIVNISQRIDTVSITTNNNQSRPHIFKLNVDCFEYLFEWFTLKQLLVLRRTCKRIQKVVDYYIKLTYPQLRRLRVNERRLSELCDARLNCYAWIRHLYLWTGLNDTQIDGIKYILNELETLKLNYVQINGDFYEVLLQHCPRLKYLGIGTCTLPKMIIGTGNDWLFRQYPTFEHLEIDVRSPCKEPLQCAELLVLFERNPNIRIFSTDSAFLLLGNQLWRGSNIKLERLNILIKHNLNSICNLTNDLFSQEFYKKLHLYGGSRAFLRDEAQHLPAFFNLEKLYLDSLPEDYPIPVMESIKELSLSVYSTLPPDSPLLIATNFINLRRITISFVNLIDLSTFIRYARNLEQIRIGDLDLENPEEPKIDDFVSLNEERKKLARARKVTIFLTERYFVKFKWVAKLNFSMIYLKRAESFVADRSFGSI